MHQWPRSCNVNLELRLHIPLLLARKHLDVARDLLSRAALARANLDVARNELVAPWSMLHSCVDWLDVSARETVCVWRGPPWQRVYTKHFALVRKHNFPPPARREERERLLKRILDVFRPDTVAVFHFSALAWDFGEKFEKS